MASQFGPLFGLLMSLPPATAHLQQMPPPIPENLDRQTDVLNHMKGVWKSVGNGMTGIEWGFRIDKAADNEGLSVVPHPNDHMMHHATFPGTDNTVAEFHNHTHGHDPKPSDIDKALGDKHKIDIYTFGEGGLYKYDWRTRKTVLLKGGLEWLK
jgi:hypothetical protein